VKELIRKTRSLTSRPFGVAIVLAFPHEENLRVVLEEKVAMLQVYWGEFPRERVEEAHRAGVKVLHQVCIILVSDLQCHYASPSFLIEVLN
jgi:NAD(P)H-dependent flavin oxidoreductase YrpB (nitropropane dioxygenase family)